MASDQVAAQARGLIAACRTRRQVPTQETEGGIVDMSTMTKRLTATTVRGFSPAVLVGGAFALTTIANTLFHVAFSIWDIRDDFGAGDRSPEEQLPVIIVIGVIGLLAALGVGKWLSDDRAPRGAVVLGALSILSLPVFFSGAPASFGAMAAVRAGFARGGSPTSGAPRGFGIAGIVIAVLIIVAVFGGNVAGIVESAAE